MPRAQRVVRARGSIIRMWSRYRLSILPFARLNIRSIDPFRISPFNPPFAPAVLPSPLAPLAYPSALLPSSSAVGNSVFSPRLPPGPSISVSCTHRGPLSRTPALTRDNEPTPTHVRIGEYVQCRSFPAETLLRLLFSSRQLYSVNRAPMPRLVVSFSSEKAPTRTTVKS